MLGLDYSMCFIFYLPTELQCLYKVEKHFSIILVFPSLHKLMLRS